MRAVTTFGVVGTGVIGAGWAARALGRGWDVVAFDPAPGAEDRMRATVDRAWPSVRKLGLYPGASLERLRFAASVDEVAAAADFVQESAPENEELKRDVLAAIDAAAPPDVVIASSSSGLLPTRIQASCRHPERVVIGHPFNPVYLLPLVEIVAGEHTSDTTVKHARAVYEDMDMYPLVVRYEIEGYLSDRLQEAVWREILHLVNDGIATTAELDDAIVYGPGLRWSAMGTNLTFHLAGGDHGMRYMLEHFGPALQLPWTKLEAPDLTPELIDRMVAGTGEQAGERTIAELERQRDEYLLAVMYALRESRLGAGAVIAAREGRTADRSAPRRWAEGDDLSAPLELYQCRVVPSWVDYNDHMTESAYLLAFGWASDALFRYLGIDEAYREAGHSYYTVESHINYFREASTGDPLTFTTQILDADTKRMHLYHAMYHGDTGDLLCTTEQMLLHVDTAAARTTPTLPGPQAILERIAAAHRHLPPPDYAGRTMGIGS